MRVVISSYDSIGNPYYNGGGARSIHEVAKRVGGVRVITSRYPGSSDGYVDGVFYQHIGGGNAQLGQILFQMELIRWVSKTDFDVWLESFTPPWSTAFLPLFTSKRVIGLVHMLGGDYFQSKYKLPFKLVEGWGLKTYGEFIVMTPGAEHKILQYNARAKVNVVGNGVELQKITKKTAKHVLYLGRIDILQKGLDLLLNAFAMIPASLPLLIGGRGLKEEEKKLQRLILELGLGDRVKWIGQVGETAKKALFEEAAFVVCPSRFEAFNIVVLEAASFGLPAASFDIDGLAWTGQNTGLKVKPFVVQEYKAAIERLLSDSVLRNTLGVEARKMAESFEWKKVSQKYKAILVNEK